MIQKFVDSWFKKEAVTRAWFNENPATEYIHIVRAAINAITDTDEGGWNPTPDPVRINEIDDGNYQGTLVYVIGETGYQPSRYWYVRVSYGSCSGCDTLARINGWGYWGDDDAPRQSEEKAARVAGYMTLALHIIQGLREMEGELV